MLDNIINLSNAQTNWYKYPGNPVFEPGKKGDWDQNIIDFAILYDYDQYHMWYSAWAKDATGHSAFGSASSHDGIHWTKYEGNPLIFDCNGSPWDEKYWTFDVIRKDSLYLMWYTAESKASGQLANIGFAWSQDGLNWTKHADPVLQHGDRESWEAAGIGGPCVLYEDGRYHMWYNGVSYRMPKVVRVGYATSEDGIHWEKYPANPVFDAGEQGTFDDHWVVANDVTHNGSEFKMWYFGWNYIQFEIGLATSDDGINWTRSFANPVLKTGDIGSWDMQMIAVADVITFDSISRMFYWGSNNVSSKLGYATTSAKEKQLWERAEIVMPQREIRVQIFNNLEYIKVDSLIRIIPELSGRDLIDAFNKLALAYSLNDDEKSYYYANKALKLANKARYPKGRAMALYCKGNSQYVLDNYSGALVSQLLALWIFDSLGMQNEAANLLSQIASIHSFTGSHEQAAGYHKQALEIFEALYDTGSVMRTLDYLGHEKLMAGDTGEAINTFHQRLSMAKSITDYRAEGFTYEALGVSYSGFSLDTSMYYFANARMIWDTLEWSQLGINYLKVAETYFASGPQYYSKAEEYFLKSYDILLASIGAGQDQLRLIGGMAELYLETGRHEKAKEYLDLSLEMCHTYISKHDHQMYVSLNNKLEYGIFLKAFMEKAYRLYYRLDIVLKDKDAALQHFQMATAWSDSVYSDRNWKKVAMIQAEHETEISKSQISVLEKDNELKNLTIHQSRVYLFALGGIFIIFIFMALLFVRQNKIRAEHKAVVLEQKLLRLQMNPHFIFNALSGIMNAINKKELRKATDYLGSFSQLLRSTLQGSREEYIHLEEEIRSLKNYLDLQSLRFANKFEYTIEIDEKIDQENTIIPPMLIQPFVENAVEHGISHKEEKGNIKLSFKLADKKLICEVEDDGVGRAKASELKYSVRNTHKSLATKIIQDRIQILNKKSKIRISLAIVDLKTDDGVASGTRVILKLPYLID